MKTPALCIATLAFFVAGCSKPSANDLFTQAREAQKAQQFPKALQLYANVVREYPQTAVAETSMFAIAAIRQNDTHELTEAVNAYAGYIEKYPDGSYAPVSLFLIGYIYNNELHNLDSAAVAYRRFLAKYPQHEMARSAQFELDHLGKPIDEFLQQQASTERPASTSQASGPSGKRTTRK